MSYLWGVASALSSMGKKQKGHRVSKVPNAIKWGMGGVGIKLSLSSWRIIGTITHDRQPPK